MAFQSGQNRIHVALIQELTKEITHEGFMKLKELSQVKDFGGFGAGELEKITTLSELFSKLQQKTIFKAGSYGKLRQLLEQSGNSFLIDIVTEAERKLIAEGIPVHGLPPVDSSHLSAMAHTDYQYRYLPQERMHLYSQLPMKPDPFVHPASSQARERSDAMPSTTYSSNGAGQYQSNQFQQFPASHGHSVGHGPHSTMEGIVPNLNTTNQTLMQGVYYQGGPGYILFINNFFHTKRTVQGEIYDVREGADIDRQNILNLHSGFLSQHQLKPKEELGKDQFWATLEKVRTKINNSPNQYSFFMLIVSSHGNQTPQQESIILPDSSSVTVDEIQQYFNGRNAPALIGKPKVFVIQACRGTKAAGGVPDLADCSGQQTVVPKFTERLSRPENADVLIAYSTSKGTKSWRNAEEGTWYIRHLCDAIRFNNKTGNPEEHFLDLLLRVHRDIAAREAKCEERAKQMPCYLTTFTKKFLL